MRKKIEDIPSAAMQRIFGIVALSASLVYAQQPTWAQCGGNGWYVHLSLESATDSLSAQDRWNHLRVRFDLC